MPTALYREPPQVAKRKAEESRPPPEPPFARIEVHASPAWVQALDEAAKALGMSRSAYIRMACNRQMSADRKDR